jgi:FlaA1/EpsC-like NDP-sugar epimerase
VIDTGLNRNAIALPVEPYLSYVHAIRPFQTVACLLIVAAFTVVVSLMAATAMRDYFLHSVSKPLYGAMLPAAVLVLASLMAGGLYPGVGINPVEEIRKTNDLSITLAFLSLWSATFFLRDLSGSRLVFGLDYVSAVIGVPALRAFARSRLSRKAWWGSQVAILGYGETGRLVLDRLQRNPSIGLKPIAVLDDDATAWHIWMTGEARRGRRRAGWRTRRCSSRRSN